MSEQGLTASMPPARAASSEGPRDLRGFSPSPRTRRTLRRALSIAACLAFWQIAASRHVDFGLVNLRNVPALSEVIAAGWQLLQSPKVFFHVRNSLFRVFAGFVLAGVSGIGFGLWIGRSKIAEDVILPPLELLRPIPGVAWIPLAILMFPSSEVSMIFITYMGALFPIVLNTIHGVAAIDGRLIDTARSLGARPLDVFFEVVLPGALPSIVTGLSIGMGTCWFCLVTAEMIAGQYGIGYYTWESYNLQVYPGIVVGMVFIGIFGMLSSVLVKRIGARLMPWQRTTSETA